MAYLVSSGVLLMLVLPLALAMWTWRRNRRLEKELYEHSCPLCSTSFSDTLPVVVGPVTEDQLQMLDRFQQRFAGSAIECQSCGGMVLCSREGFPMRGYYPEKVAK